jgi:hypothetical protein
MSSNADRRLALQSGLAIGGAAFGPVGAIAGTLAGTIAAPRLFPPDAPQPPSLDDQPINQTQEGAPLPRCYGPYNRLGGVVIWASDIRQEANTEGAGKGGGAVTWRRYRDVALAVCEGPVAGIREIRGNGKVFWRDGGETGAVSSTEIATVDTYLAGQARGLARHIYSADANADLRELAGLQIQISGFLNAANNGGPYRVYLTGQAGDGTTFLTISDTDSVTEASGELITITGESDEEALGSVDDVTVHLGSAPQTPDSYIEAQQGEDVPGWPNVVYVVLQNLDLTEFGGQLPQFTFTVKEATTRSLADVIADILQRSGLAAAQYDVSAVTGNVSGYVVNGAQPAGETLQPLLAAFDLVAYEDAGVLTFAARTAGSSHTVAADDLAASSGGGQQAAPVEFTERPDTELPREVAIKFLDTERDNQQGSVRARRNKTTLDGSQSLHLPIAMDSDAARTIAERVLWQAWMERRTVRLSLPPSYLDINPGDRLTVTVSTESYTVRATHVAMGADMALQIEGVVEESRTYDATADASDTGDATLYVPPLMALEVMDIAPLADSDAHDTGLYIAAAAADRTLSYRGATIYDSPDDTTYSELRDAGNEAVMGYAQEALADGPVGIWDRGGSVQVYLQHGTLSSATELAVLAGTNWALLGDEIIGFRTATLDATGFYTLTNLLRGLRATADQTASHAENERFVLLSGAKFQTLNIGLLNAARYYKAVAVGATEADIDGESTTPTGRNIQPFPPAQLAYSRDGSNNITFTWQRTTRYLVNEFAATIPNEEPDQKYEIDIVDGSSVVQRTIQVSDATTTTYAIADQTSDGVNASAFTANFYRISQTIGRSKVAALSVAAP